MDMLARERKAAQRLIDARRAQVAQATLLDEFMLCYARDLAASQPRCDYTIAQLPTLSSVLSTDLIPVYHNGQTYAAQANVVSSVTPIPAIVYNVMSYGAHADGATDDTTAIQSAITAASTAGGGIVFLPPGVYAIIAGSIQPANNVALVGAGRFCTTLRARGVASGGSIIGTPSSVSNIRFEGITFDCQTEAIHAMNLSAVGLSDITIDSCGFINGGAATLISMGNPSVSSTTPKLIRPRVQNCYFYGGNFSSADLLVFSAAQSGIVSGCLFDLDTAVSSASSACVFWYNYCKDCLTIGNIFRANGNFISYNIINSDTCHAVGNYHYRGASSGAWCVEISNVQDVSIDGDQAYIDPSAFSYFLILQDANSPVDNTYALLYANTTRLHVNATVEGGIYGIAINTALDAFHNTSPSNITIQGQFFRQVDSAIYLNGNAGTACVNGLHLKNMTIGSPGTGFAFGGIALTGTNLTSDAQLQSVKFLKGNTGIQLRLDSVGGDTAHPLSDVHISNVDGLNSGLIQYNHSAMTATVQGSLGCSGNTYMDSGTATLAAGTVQVTLPQPYASTSSYQVIAQDTTTAANTVTVTNNSTTQFTLTGTGTDVVKWIAVGTQ